MSTLFDNFFDPDSKPYRRDAHVKLTHDEEGNLVAEPIERETVTMSPDDSIDRVKITLDRFYHCGCSAQNPQGGKCGEPGCNRISCANCFGRCSDCSKPTCLEHARIVAEGQQRIRLCRACADQRKRKKMLWSVIGIFLSPK